MDNEICYLKLEDIVPNRYQPREVFDEESLSELSKSIHQHGVIQPIIVRTIGNGYEIIDGERRYRASIMANQLKIPAIIRNYNDQESSRVALIDNLQRKDFTPIEEARAYKRLISNDGLTQGQLANEIGKSQSAVANKIRLLNLPLEIQDALLKQEISERHARSLLTIKDTKVQIEMLKKIKENKMTVRELDSEIKNMSNMFIPDQYSNSIENNENGNNIEMNNNNSNMFIPSFNDNESNSNSNNSSMFVPPFDSNKTNEGFMGNKNNGMLNVPIDNQYINDSSLDKELPSNTGIISNQTNYGNPFFTNNSYNSPKNNEVNETNPFSNIRMKSNELNNDIREENLNNYSNINNETQQSTINYDETPDFTKLSPPENSSFNIDDYKLPGVDYNNESSVPLNSDIETDESSKYDKYGNMESANNLDDVINILQFALSKIKSGKVKVETEETDFEDIYQIVIKVDKKGDFN